MNKKNVPPFSIESGLMLRRYDSVERVQQIELRLSLCPGVSFILSNRVRVSCGPKDLAKRERRTKHDLTRKCLTFATWYLLVFSFVRPAVRSSARLSIHRSFFAHLLQFFLFFSLRLRSLLVGVDDMVNGDYKFVCVRACVFCFCCSPPVVVVGFLWLVTCVLWLFCF